MVLFECKKCKHIWDYKGNKDIATCTNCGYKTGFKLKEEIKSKC